MPLLTSNLLLFTKIAKVAILFYWFRHLVVVFAFLTASAILCPGRVPIVIGCRSTVKAAVLFLVQLVYLARLLNLYDWSDLYHYDFLPHHFQPLFRYILPVMYRFKPFWYIFNSYMLSFSGVVLGFRSWLVRIIHLACSFS